MKSMSLRLKLALIGITPLFFLSILSGKEIWTTFQTYKEASQVSKNMIVIQAVSRVIHETQIERGKTATYMGGATELPELVVQRNHTTEAAQAFIGGAADIKLSDTAQIEPAINAMAEYEDLRNAVNNKKIAVPEVLKKYSEIIARLLKLELAVASDTKIGAIKSPLYSMAVLEEAKENAGKLRAQLSAVLAQNAPIDDEKFAQITNLKSRVDANLGSPALVVSPESSVLIAELSMSKEWKEVSRVFKLVLSQASIGKYNVDPKEFFLTISTVVNSIGKLVQGQHTFIFAQVDGIYTSSRASLITNSIFLVLAVSALTFITIFMASQLSKTLEQIAKKLSSGSNQVASSSESIAESGTELSAAATEQAAALQETVAAVDEINAMVLKNADSAGKSSQVATESHKAVSQGKQTVADMIDAIDQIRESNGEITAEMQQSNDEISAIVSVIKEIAEKTKVINDIVFQTKLLSFNASVEAARAGEHGKGFSVVAEEVGNLAAMSGKAAKEISDMLGASTQRVEGIVSKTKSKIDHIVTTGKEKVAVGTQTAQKCGQVLDTIFENSSTINEIVSEIATASKEQARGIQEISKAMAQLDQVTQQNTTVSEQSSASAASLSDQAADLNFVVSELMLLVVGGKSNSPTGVTSVGAAGQVIRFDERNMQRKAS